MKIIYPGTFDPFSMGHLDIALRAAKMCDELVIAVSESDNKKPMFSMETRIKLAQIAVEGVDNVTVEGFTGLLVDFMSKNSILHVLRGIRGMVDFDYEFQMARANRSMLPGFEPIFLMPSEQCMVISSTIIREMIRLGADASLFLPKNVYQYIKSL